MKSKISSLSLLLIIAASLCLPAAFAGDFLTVSLVNQDPDPALAGNIVEVRLGVENTGSTLVEDIIIEFDEQYPFKMVAGESPVKEVGTLDSYQHGDDYKVLKYRIQVDKDATAGQYELVFWQYKKGLKESAATKRSANIEIKSKEGAEVIYIDKTSLVPGKQTSLQFVINNVGSAPLRDLTFSWKNEDGIILPVGSDNTKYIKYIEIGDSAELQYKVIADTNANPGLYALNLNLTYEDSITGEEKKISTVAGVYVGGETDFDVAFSGSSAGETSFSVANIGSNPAYSVSVVIPKQQGWMISGANSVIIGNLNKGDYTVASFSLQSGRNFTSLRDTATTGNLNSEEIMKQRAATPTSNTILVQIAYTDTMGERKTVEKEVQLSAQNLNAAQGAVATSGMRGRFGVQQESFFSKYKWYIVGAVALIAGFVIYRKHKKKK